MSSSSRNIRPHIFELRYRQMTDEASSDGLIAVALLQPGWEGDYYGSPLVHPVACAGDR
jgi:hypothetical protein